MLSKDTKVVKFYFYDMKSFFFRIDLFTTFASFLFCLLPSFFCTYATLIFLFYESLNTRVHWQAPAKKGRIIVYRSYAKAKAFCIEWWRAIERNSLLFDVETCSNCLFRFLLSLRPVYKKSDENSSRTETHDTICRDRTTKRRKERGGEDGQLYTYFDDRQTDISDDEFSKNASKTKHVIEIYTQWRLIIMDVLWLFFYFVGTKIANIAPFFSIESPSTYIVIYTYKNSR